MTTKAESSPVERIGAYRVVRRLATGGTSDVLLAKAEGPHGFERTVVLKVLLSHFGKDDEVAKMFAREASAYARLSHPAIVRLFDFFAVPGSDPKKGGQLVMVLEFVDGPPLARLKSMAKAIGKELDDKASIYIAACIFDALAAAHSAVDDAQLPAPVIHRDVNPSNVLIPWDGYPKLADFGVAKVTGLGHHSVIGMIKGTYGYMAPEQVTGGEAVTPRSDVYAAGIVLWELLARRRAFQRGALPEVEALRAMAEPRLPALESIRSDIDRTVRESLRRCLEPRADKRKITAEEMVSILHAIVPPDQGRERLMSLLGLVRNDARAVNAQGSVAPPPMPTAPRSEPLLPDVVIPGAPKMAPDFGAHTMSGLGAPATSKGVAPPPGQPSGLMAKAPPRPNVSSAKMPAASPAFPSSAKMAAEKSAGIPTSTLSSAGMPQANVASPDPNAREILSLPTRPAMPAVSAPVAPPPPPPQWAGSKPAMPAVTAGGLPPAEGPPRTKSAAARLAVSLPPETVDEALPARPLNSILDGLRDSPVPDEHQMSVPPDSPRVAAPLKDLTGGLGLRDAIDEIMKSSQRGVRAATPAALGAETPLPIDKPPQMRETTRVPPGMTSTLIGLIPPAPPPMTPSAFPTQAVVDSSPPPNQNEVVTTPPTPQNEWANSIDDPDDEPRDTTVVMEPIPPLPRLQAQGLTSTVMMEARPQTPSQPVPYHTPAPTPAMHSPEPPHVSRPPPQQHYVGADPRPSKPVPSYGPPPRKGVGVGTVAVVLIVVIAAGIAGTVGFVRYQAQKELVDAGAYVPPPRPTASLAVATSVEAPATAERPAEPPAVDASTTAASAPDASPATPPATAIAADAAPAEPVAEGMGQLKTTGAAPGRRIFVDDKVAGQTPETLTLKCGPHKVKLGSTGTTQDVDVPCAGDVTVGDK
ncbi:MAG: protein kinase [Labilithrix sp.]